MSSLQIEDARRYFAVNDELLLKVEECDVSRKCVVLSNIDTDTDPKRLVESFDGDPDVARDATVERIAVSRDGWETGLIVAFPGENLRGFVPRSSATYSRFERLSDRYAVGVSVRVCPVKFDVRFKTFVCRLDGLDDPWVVAAKYRVNDQLEVMVRQISERYIICEPLPGVEGMVPFHEVSWGSEEEKKKALAECDPGGKTLARIVDIDITTRRLRLSLKRVTASPVYEYFTHHSGQCVQATVTQAASSHAIVVLGSEHVQGYLHVSDLMWAYCDDLTTVVSVGETLLVNVMSHDDSFDNIRVSHKHTYTNYYDAFTTQHNTGDEVMGKVIACVADRVIVRVCFAQDQQVEGYVHKSEVSNVMFVDDAILEKIFVPGRDYRYVVKRLDERQSVIELSRKTYLREQIVGVRYGEVYTAAPVCESRGRVYLHGDSVEGFLKQGRGTSVSPRGLCRVFPAKIDSGRAYIEFELAEGE